MCSRCQTTPLINATTTCRKSSSASLPTAKGTNRAVGIYPWVQMESPRVTSEPRDKQSQTVSLRPRLWIHCQSFNTEAPYKNYNRHCQQHQSPARALQFGTWASSLGSIWIMRPLCILLVWERYHWFLQSSSQETQPFTLHKKTQKGHQLSFLPPPILPLVLETLEFNNFVRCSLATSWHNSC